MAESSDNARSRGREPTLAEQDGLPVLAAGPGIDEKAEPALLADEADEDETTDAPPERVVGLGAGLARTLTAVGLVGFGAALAAAAWLFYDPAGGGEGPPRYVLNPDGPPGSIMVNPGLAGGNAAGPEDASTAVDAPATAAQPADLPPIALLGRASDDAAADTGAVDEEVDTLLQRARASLDALRLTTPAEDSAFYYYQQVLALDPGNPEADAGMARIAERYAWLVEREIGRGQLERARSFLELGLSIRPEHPDLLRASTNLYAAEQLVMDRGGAAESVPRPAPPPF